MRSSTVRDVLDKADGVPTAGPGEEAMSLPGDQVLWILV